MVVKMNYILVFMAFCALQLAFSIAWKFLEGRIAQRQLRQRIDLIYAELVKKILKVREDLRQREEGGNDL